MFDTASRAGATSSRVGGDSHAAWTFLGMPEPQLSETGTTPDSHQSASLEQKSFKPQLEVDEPLPVDGPLRIPAIVLESESASPIQIWEGTVQHVLALEGMMRVSLQAKLAPVPDHFADIDLEWVAEQDRDLVKPGAVFYLSLYKGRTLGGTIRNAQELKFRRLPAWTSRDAAVIDAMALRLLAKGKMDDEAP